MSVVDRKNGLFGNPIVFCFAACWFGHIAASCRAYRRGNPRGLDQMLDMGHVLLRGVFYERAR